MFKIFILFFILILSGHVVLAFVPLKVVEPLIRITDEKTSLDLGKIGETLAHETILKHGL